MSTDIFIADVDGTLTPARLPMEDSFAEFLKDFVQNRPFYIVTGSDYNKTCEQVPQDILLSISGAYTSLGNELYQNGKLVYSRNIETNEKLLADLEKYRESTKYPYDLYPNYIEQRQGMVNFSVLGRNCPYEARVKYFEWDNHAHERENIAKELAQNYPEYNFYLGGNISIDIVQRGRGKDQVADQLRKKYPTERMIFFGDRIFEGGNDYPLAQRLLQFGNAEIEPVRNPDDVKRIIQKKYFDD